MSDPIITSIHPKVISSLLATVNEMKARGVIVGMESSLRSADEQARLYSLGRTVVNPDGKSDAKPFGDIVTNAQPWTSWHCFGLAVDITPKNEKGQFFWWPDDSHEWVELATVAKMFGFEWGGAWATFKGDLDHFQMRGIIPNVHIAKEILFEKGQSVLWGMV